MNKLKNKNVIKKIAMFTVGFLSSLGLFAQEIEVNGLFKNSAIVSIDGKQAVLKVGKTYKNNIRLISSTSKQAIIEVNGKKETYNLSSRISQSYSAPKTKQIRIQAGQNNHYYYRAKINGFGVDVLVDTGASAIAINSLTAKRLGLSKKQSLGDVYVNTANSRVKGYLVNLREIALGPIKLNNIQAIVMPNDYPKTILLGNTFLAKCDMQIENGVLVLTSKI